jgi:CRP-like cAMP-binding protein
MTLKTMVWAIDHSPTYDPTSRLILVAMADDADGEGKNCFTSVSTIAKKAAISVSTCRRRMDEMEAAGIIRRGDQRLAAHIPANRRPVVFDLAIWMDRKAQDVVTDSDSATSYVNLNHQPEPEVSCVTDDIAEVPDEDARCVKNEPLVCQNPPSGVSEMEVRCVTDDTQHQKITQKITQESNPLRETDVSPQTELALFAPSAQMTVSSGPTTRDLIAEWLDNCPQRPPSRVVGQMAQQVGKLFSEGYAYEQVRNALIELHAGGKHPSLLPNILYAQQSVIPMVGTAVSRKPSTAEQRAGAGFALAEKFRQQGR